LPAFVREGGPATWNDIIDGLRLTGHFLARDLLTDRLEPLLDARARLVDRLRRAGGLA
jgi:DNA repair protein RecO (recombination protein O)